LCSVFYNWVLKHKLTSLLKQHLFIKGLRRGELAYKVTRLLEILGDGKWHGTEKLKQLMGFSDCELQEITNFLGAYDFAEIDETKKRVRINKDFKKILTQAV
jgi:hypothetical protein